MLGYTQEEVLGKHFSELITPESLQVFQDNFSTFKERGWVRDLEFQMRCKDGSIFPVSLNATAVKSDSGEYLFSRSAVIDIRERKQAEAQREQAEQELRQAKAELEERVIERTTKLTMKEKQLRDFFNAAAISGIGLGIHDRQKRFVKINQTLADINGAPIADHLGKTVEDMVPEMAPMIDPLFDQVLTTGQPIINLELQGSLRWQPDVLHDWLVNFFPTFAEDGSTNGLGTVVFDVSDRKQAEAALRQQFERERLLSNIVQHMRASLDLSDIINISANEIRASLQVDRVLVYRLNPDRSGRVLAESMSSKAPPILAQTFSAAYFPPETYQRMQQAPIVVPNRTVDRQSPYHPDAQMPGLLDFMEQYQVQALFIAPIIQQGMLWGTLVLHQFDQPRDWQPWEQQLLCDLANQMAIAIQQSELYEQLQTELRERRLTEEALRDSEARFRSLSESSPIGGFHADALGQLTYSNPRCQEISGCILSELLGTRWAQAVHPEDRQSVLSQWWAAVAAERGITMNLRFQHADGSIRFARVQTAPVLAVSCDEIRRECDRHQLLGYVGCVEDITDSLAIAQMKNEFISVVSHELRTPLTSLRGSLGMLASGVYDNKPEKSKRMLSIAADSADRLARLVSDILDLERLESGKVALMPQACDAAELVNQAVEGQQTSASQKQITLSVTPFHALVWAAPDSIIQTLTNLINNAIKFSEPGSTIWIHSEFMDYVGEVCLLSDRASLCSSTLPDSLSSIPPASSISPSTSSSISPSTSSSISTSTSSSISPSTSSSISTSTSSSTSPSISPSPSSSTSPSISPSLFSSPTTVPTHVLFSVRDEGRGIPADKLESIFGQFQQVDASDSRQKGGTGLGLSICRSIIQQQGGSIWVKSSLGQGSTFYFTLPLPPPEGVGSRE
jgi:PAS domain S-box-containing protein